MNIDIYDIRILRCLRNIQKKGVITPATTTQIAKEVFGDMKKDLNKLRAKDTFVRRRLKKLIKLNLINKDKLKSNGREVNAYSTNDSQFILGSGDIIVEPDFEKKKFEFSVEDILFVKTKEGLMFYGEIES